MGTIKFKESIMISRMHSPVARDNSIRYCIAVAAEKQQHVRVPFACMLSMPSSRVTKTAP